MYDDVSAKKLKNKRFLQMYDQGLDVIDKLMKDYPLAGRVYVWLSRNCGRNNAIIVSQELLAEKLEVTSRSIRTATKYLQDEQILLRHKVGGNKYMYLLNPEEVWKGYYEEKKNAMWEVLYCCDNKEQKEIEFQIRAYFKTNKFNDDEFYVA